MYFRIFGFYLFASALTPQIYAFFFFFFQAEDGIRDLTVTGVQTCALPISPVHIVLPTAGGTILPKVAKALKELIDVGLIKESPCKIHSAQASGSAPVIQDRKSVV